ncbi:MAG: LamB/YcsF family protein [Vicinamibacteria bacterium]|nr:LamB/YcsF family protein [Vicinamibacteria bacterium]
MADIIDLNADVGESFGPWPMGSDAGLLPFVTSVNVACGFHAGDPIAMDRTVSLALERGIRIGAHPSHLDLRGFGRREIQASPEEVETDVLYQAGALRAFVESRGGRLWHVKPHGALYNQAAKNESLARAIARGVRRLGGGVTLVGLATSPIFRDAARIEGVPFAGEAFVDRAYEADGTLAKRGTPGALLDSGEAAARQAVSIARDGKVTARDGSPVAVTAETLCLHGDNRSAIEIARAVRQALEAAGVKVQALGPHGPA